MDAYADHMNWDDVVGYAEIIDRSRTEFDTEFPLSTVRNWEKYRRAWVEKGRPMRSESRPREIPMPDPEAAVNRSPAWSWATIRQWLIDSQRVQSTSANERAS